MHRREILKDRIYFLISNLLCEENVDRTCDNLDKLGIYSSKLHDLILMIESDFEISLKDLLEDYEGINSVDYLCNCVEIELYSQ